MMYRAKCTHCIPQMENVYNPKAYYYCKDAKDTYVEVYSEEEAILIEEVNEHMKEAYYHYKDLIEMKETKDNSDY